MVLRLPPTTNKVTTDKATTLLSRKGVGSLICETETMTGSYFVAQSTLKLTGSTCFCLSNFSSKDMCHHA